MQGSNGVSGNERAPSGVVGGKEEGGDGAGANLQARFYSALYVKLLSPDLGGASNPVLFLNLVYKAVKADKDGPRAAAFSKRLLQVRLRRTVTDWFACCFGVETGLRSGG